MSTRRKQSHRRRAGAAVHRRIDALTPQTSAAVREQSKVAFAAAMDMACTMIDWSPLSDADPVAEPGWMIPMARHLGHLSDFNFRAISHLLLIVRKLALALPPEQRIRALAELQADRTGAG